MELVEHFQRQFAYDAWANREILNGLRPSGGSDHRAPKLLAHIVSAERLWLERIQKQTQSMAVWPDLSLEQCGAQIDDLSRLWGTFFTLNSKERFSETVVYQNSKGEPWRNTVEDILTHVLLHSAYHRGQIAIQVRAEGQQPAYTDFIHAVRQSLIE
jgi:uncharacterized damage-inducible protein DinB